MSTPAVATLACETLFQAEILEEALIQYLDDGDPSADWYMEARAMLDRLKNPD